MDCSGLLWIYMDAPGEVPVSESGTCKSILAYESTSTLVPLITSMRGAATVVQEKLNYYVEGLDRDNEQHANKTYVNPDPLAMANCLHAARVQQENPRQCKHMLTV